MIRHGFVVALPEFRRTGGAGGWPQTADDVAAALAAVPTLVEEVAPGRIDPQQASVVAGHSAGGHLALWAGLRAGSRRVSHIVALAPVTDLAHAAHEHLGNDAAQDLMAGEPEDLQDAYADADAFSGLAIHHDAAVIHPRITIIHGTADDVVPATMSRAAATKHPRVHHLELDGVDHFALVDPLSEAFRTVVLPTLIA
jgi:acetyl esterase/lipase